MSAKSSPSSVPPHVRTHKPGAQRIAVGALVLLLIGIGLWWNRVTLLEWSLQQLLARTSLSIPKFSGLRLGLDQSSLDEIAFGMETSAGPVGVELKNTIVTYKLSGPKVDAISVAHARLNLTYLPVGKPETQAPGDIWQFPLQRLNVEQLDMEVNTPWGLSHFAGHMEIKLADSGLLEASFQNAKHRIRFEFRTDFSAAKTIIDRLDGDKVLELNANRLNQAKLQVNLDANAGSLLEWLTASELLPEALRAKAAVGNYPELRPGIESIRLRLTTEATSNFNNAQGRLMLTREQGYLASADIKMHDGAADIDGHLDMSAKDAFDLIRPWLPVSAGGWQLFSGGVRGTAKLTWQPQRNITGAAHFTAFDIGLIAAPMRIENGYFELDSQDIGKRSFALSMAIPKMALGEKTTLHNLDIKAQILGRELTLQQAALPMFGGLIEILPATVNIDQRPIRLTLGVQNVDLSQLLESLNYPALSGSGIISGKLPLSFNEDAIVLEGGTLKGTRPGVFQYQGPVADNENIAFKALRNLKYHSLAAEINYRPNGDYHLGLRLEGHNPEVLSGHPLAFNLNLSGQLPELLKNGILTGDFEHSILEQATTRPADTQESAEPSPGPQ